MKWIFTILLLTVSAFAQSQYGADYILLRAVTTDGNSNLNFGNFPRSGFAPSASAIGSVSLYFDSAAACIKASINGGAYACLGGGGGSGTVNANNGSAGAGTFYPAAAGSTTVSALSGLTYDAVGNATLAQGSIAVSTPVFSHTGTWNAAGVAFTNWLSNITCTAAATASIAAGWGVAGTTWQMKFNGATCTNPQFLVPNGTAGSPSIAASGGTNTGFAFTGSQVQIVASGTGRVFVDTRLLTAVPIADSGTGNSQLNFAAGLITVQGTGVPNFGFNQGKGQHFVTQAANNDMAGTCTFATTTCTVTFTTAYSATPSCVANDRTAAAPVQSAPTTTNVVFTGGTGAGATDVINYICVGNPN